MLLFGLFSNFSMNAQAQPIHHNDPPGVHGMLLFGCEKTYLSHLPIFHSPHDYQVILEVNLSEEAKKIYLQARKNNAADTIYTLVPEAFVLPERINNPKPFTASIFQGHFERGGTPIATDVMINISKLIYSRKFEPNDTHPDKVKYIYFGDENEIFGAHFISAKPDFDHIVKVEPLAMLLNLLSSQTFIELEFSELEKQTPLKVGPSPKSTAIIDGKPLDIEPHKIQQELYLEFQDLSF